MHTLPLILPWVLACGGDLLECPTGVTPPVPCLGPKTLLHAGKGFSLKWGGLQHGKAHKSLPEACAAYPESPRIADLPVHRLLSKRKTAKVQNIVQLF